jgi:hypothetical protein
MFTNDCVFTSSEVSRLSITVCGRDFFQDFVGCDRIPTVYEQQKEPSNG